MVAVCKDFPPFYAIAPHNNLHIGASSRSSVRTLTLPNDYHSDDRSLLLTLTQHQIVPH